MKRKYLFSFLIVLFLLLLVGCEKSEANISNYNKKKNNTVNEKTKVNEDDNDSKKSNNDISSNNSNNDNNNNNNSNTNSNNSSNDNNSNSSEIQNNTQSNDNQSETISSNQSNSSEKVCDQVALQAENEEYNDVIDKLEAAMSSVNSTIIEAQNTMDQYGGYISYSDYLSESSKNLSTLDKTKLEARYTASVIFDESDKKYHELLDAYNNTEEAHQNRLAELNCN